MDHKAAFSILLILLVCSALIVPPLVYIVVGWEAKRRDIMDGLGAEARCQYFRMFQRDGDVPTRASAFKDFEMMYQRWYGRKFYYVPLLMLALTSLISVALVLFTVLDIVQFAPNRLFPLPDAAIAALSGAYMWSVNDLISRVRRLDFSPSDLGWANLRLTTAIPMGYAFGAVVTAPLASFIAFSLGAFPLAALISITRRIASKNLGIDTASEESDDGIIKLQGINRTIVERLYQEDISTVPQLAYCDPVRLTMRSNLSFNFVMDCMDQALAWMYFGTDLDKIRRLGMRGATEIKNLIDALDGADDDTSHATPPRVGMPSTSSMAVVGSDEEIPRLSLRETMEDTLPPQPKKKASEQALARTTLNEIATTLNQTPATLETAFREIAGDPYTEFLATIWGEVASRA